MLPFNNNYYPHQSVPTQGAYTFDLKVNVDFNNGRVNLNVPPPNGAFRKKSDIPIVYPQQIMMQQQYNQPSYNKPHYQQAYQPLQTASPSYQSTKNYIKNQPVYSSAHVTSPQYSNIRYSGNAKSSNDTYFGTSTSFSMNMERSMEAVECVICNKAIGREYFQAHLDEHKGRKKEYNQRQANYPYQNDNMSSFSVRNKNPYAEAADLYQQPPSQYSASRQIKERDFSRHNSSQSRQVSDTFSRIVYAPRDPSKQMSNSNLNSQYVYSQSSGNGSIQNNNVYSNNQYQQQQYVSNYDKPIAPSQPNISQYGVNPSVHKSQKANQNTTNYNRSSNPNILPSELSRMRQTPSMTNQNSYYDSNLQKSIRQASHFRERESAASRSQTAPKRMLTSNSYQLQKSGSKIIRPSESNRKMIQNCDHSVINQRSYLSKESSMADLKRHLNITQLAEQSSSDEQDCYVSSVRPYPSVKQHSLQQSYRPMDRSNYTGFTEKLSRSKLPTNYLARQEFIVNSMYNSCYRSKRIR